MTPTKILIGQMLIVFAIIVFGTWFATQWTAHALGYQIRLGVPWPVFGQWPIYSPWRLFQWWYVYDSYAPAIFSTGGIIAASSGGVGALAAIAGSVWRARQTKRVTTYGSARWATPRDVMDAGLAWPCGVFLGKTHSGYLRHEGPEHVMAFAPTRSGKGVGLVVPTLLTWPHSAVIHDIKGEN